MLADERELAALRLRFDALETGVLQLEARLEQLEMHAGLIMPAVARHAIRGGEAMAELGEMTAGEMAVGASAMGPGSLLEAGHVREACALAYDVILRSTPTGSREKSLALTKLEEACMWAVKAISRGG